VEKTLGDRFPEGEDKSEDEEKQAPSLAALKRTASVSTPGMNK
jgi:hypothetical protein